MVQKMEDDLRHLQHELSASRAQQEALRTRLAELEKLVRWQTIRGLHGSQTASVPAVPRATSRCSSREVSPSTLERKALLKLEARVSALVGDIEA